MSAKGANADMHYLFHQHKPLLSWMHWMKSMSESIWEGSVAAGKCTAGVSHSKKIKLIKGNLHCQTNLRNLWSVKYVDLWRMDHPQVIITKECP